MRIITMLLSLSVLCVCVHVYQQSTPVISGLIDTVDKVMGHMVSNLEAKPNSPVAIGGKSYVAGQWQYTHTCTHAHTFTYLCPGSHYKKLISLVVQLTLSMQMTQAHSVGQQVARHSRSWLLHSSQEVRHRGKIITQILCLQGERGGGERQVRISFKD